MRDGRLPYRPADPSATSVGPTDPRASIPMRIAPLVVLGLVLIVLSIIAATTI
jgi:hypothetical protein